MLLSLIRMCWVLKHCALSHSLICVSFLLYDAQITSGGWSRITEHFAYVRVSMCLCVVYEYVHAAMWLIAWSVRPCWSDLGPPISLSRSRSTDLIKLIFGYCLTSRQCTHLTYLYIEWIIVITCHFLFVDCWNFAMGTKWWTWSINSRLSIWFLGWVRLCSNLEQTILSTVDFLTRWKVVD